MLTIDEITILHQKIMTNEYKTALDNLLADTSLTLEQLLDQALNDANTFQKLIQRTIGKTYDMTLLPRHRQVIILATQFPSFAEKFFQIMIAALKIYVPNYQAFIEIGFYLPRYINVLIPPVMQNIDKITDDTFTFFSTVAQLFPLYAKTFIDCVLESSEKFNHFIKSSDDLCKIVQIFNAHPDMVKYSNDGRPTQAITNKFFCDKLILFLINTPETFKKLVQSDDDLHKLAKIYKGQNESIQLVLNQPTLQKALQVVDISSDRIQNVTVGALKKGEFSQRLPPDVSKLIGGLLNQKTAARLSKTCKSAHEAFNRPIVK